MTTVVKSTFRAEHAQKDGRCWVHEHHELSDGTSRDYSFLADVGLNLDRAVADRAAVINEELAVLATVDAELVAAKKQALADQKAAVAALIARARVSDVKGLPGIADEIFSVLKVDTDGKE